MKHVMEPYLLIMGSFKSSAEFRLSFSKGRNSMDPLGLASNYQMLQFKLALLIK
jgi:hypothetical protein